VAAMSRRTVAALLLSGGAFGIAATTALEVLTVPYSPAVRFHQLNGVVHVVKVAAVVALILGLFAVRGHLRRSLGLVGSAAAVTLAIATALGAVPYSLVEALLDPSLSPVAANEQLDATYAAQPWIGGLAMAALLLVVISIPTLAVVVLRRRALPRWAPIASLVAIPVAIAAGVLTEAGFNMPHPPAWIFLGLSAYGLAVAQQGPESEKSGRSQTSVRPERTPSKARQEAPLA
jgi:hypothetical protein